ncbi:MCE family protein, partial [Mycolicibacterium porcinum]|uniref:MCE family protein n=1 Tax=Mycolicibacterium porcinum TaxID=39693 RepID=UPI00256F6241
MRPARDCDGAGRVLATPIDVTAVTTEFNTLFETITAITEQVDPIKLNQTLS